MLTYLLIFIQLIWFYFFIKQGLKIKKQKRGILQLELKKERVHTLLKAVVFNRSLDTELAVLEYFMQNGIVEEEQKDVPLYPSLAEHFKTK